MRRDAGLYCHCHPFPSLLLGDLLLPTTPISASVIQAWRRHNAGLYHHSYSFPSLLSGDSFLTSTPISVSAIQAWLQHDTESYIGVLVKKESPESSEGKE